MDPLGHWVGDYSGGSGQLITRELRSHAALESKACMHYTYT